MLALMLIACGGTRSTVHDAEVHHHRHDHGWHIADRHADRPIVVPRITRPGPHAHQRTVAQGAPAMDPLPPPNAAAEVPPSPPTHRTAAKHVRPAPLIAAPIAMPDTTYDYALTERTPPVRTTWNPFALASVPLFILTLAVAIPAKSTELLLIGCALTLAAAIIGARRCRDRGERGQGFAMAVMGFAAAGVLISLIALLSRL